MMLTKTIIIRMTMMMMMTHTMNTVRIAHLRIGYLVGNPEVGNPDPYQLSGLPTFIITLFMCCPGLIWPLKVWCSHVQCILKQYSRFYFVFFSSEQSR